MRISFALYTLSFHFAIAYASSNKSNSLLNDENGIQDDSWGSVTANRLLRPNASKKQNPGLALGHEKDHPGLALGNDKETGGLALGKEKKKEEEEGETAPSASPSEFLSGQPSAIPSTAPMDLESDFPSIQPSGTPSITPSEAPNSTPSTNPSAFPSTVPSLSASNDPTFVPSTQPSSVPSVTPSTGPTELASATPSMVHSDAPSVVPIPRAASLARDQVSGTLLNGPIWGMRHTWAWPAIRDTGCGRYSYSAMDTGTAATLPCGVTSGLLDRVFNFDSSYMNFQFAFGQEMVATLSLAGTTQADSKGSISPMTFRPFGTTACSVPDGTITKTYPIELVRSGRYLHHWLAHDIDCSGDGVFDTRIEWKVTPDCIELHMISSESAAGWRDASGNIVASSTNGYSVVSFCTQCSSELNAGLDNDGDLTGCTIVQAQVPQDCCPLVPLNKAGRDNPATMCGTGWSYSTCTASQRMATASSTDVTVSTVPSDYPILADGHSFDIRIDRLDGLPTTPHNVKVNIANTSTQWKKVKQNFHVVSPRRITGVSAVLRDVGSNKPTGIHVQHSKNWHPASPIKLYDDWWFTGVAHIRIPPGDSIELELIVAFQYYEGLHTVSHSQLSLIGWGTHGLWEEVGLGSNGESITYEPHGHHRRQMVLDTRPWLTCAKNFPTSCVGNPDNTQWTENHGGGDFLNAVNKRGEYQYLVGDTVNHLMNGPRMTNATYDGTTVDGNIHVSRAVSTWTADDMVRHLHSFTYTFLNNVDGDNYPKFAMYTLGGDNYNFVKGPLFTYGKGNENSLSSTGTEVLSTTQVISGLSDAYYSPDYFQVEAPIGCSQGENGSCWFAMVTDPSLQPMHNANRGLIVRNFHGQLGGSPWPPPNSNVSPFTFSLIKGRAGSAKLTVSVELGLPTAILEQIRLGTFSFQEGDYLTGDLELFLPPRLPTDYIGNSQRLRGWLTEAGTSTDFQNGWKVIQKEAYEGDRIQTTVFKGDLERKYTPRIQVERDNQARFNIQIPANMPGILPITISGVGRLETFSTDLLDTPNETLYRYVGGSWIEFAPAGNYQLVKDVDDNSYTYVFSLKLEFEVPAVQLCESFAFGPAPPSDENLSCVIAI